MEVLQGLINSTNEIMWDEFKLTNHNLYVKLKGE